MGAVQAAIKRIPCGCESCIEMTHIAWDQNITNIVDQPRFLHNTKYKYINLFGELNDWNIVRIENKEKDSEWTMNEVKKDVSMGIVTRIAAEIKIGGFGAYMIKDDQSNGYNIIRWKTR